MHDHTVSEKFDVLAKFAQVKAQLGWESERRVAVISSSDHSKFTAIHRRRHKLTVLTFLFSPSHTSFADCMYVIAYTGALPEASKI